MNNRAILACVFSVLSTAAVMLLIGSRPANVRTLEVKNESLQKQNRALVEQVELLNKQVGVLEKMNALRQAELDAVNKILAAPNP